MAGRVYVARFSVGLDARGEGKAGDGEAHHLALTAAKATHRVAHEEDFSEIL